MQRCSLSPFINHFVSFKGVLFLNFLSIPMPLGFRSFTYLHILYICYHRWCAPVLTLTAYLWIEYQMHVKIKIIWTKKKITLAWKYIQVHVAFCDYHIYFHGIIILHHTTMFYNGSCGYFVVIKVGKQLTGTIFYRIIF